MTTTTIKVTDRQLKAFLKYFYYCEQLAGDGDTSKYWNRSTEQFCSKLYDAEEIFGVHIDVDAL